MTFEIQTMRDDGSGYMVVTNEDGTTFGQNFHHMPVHDRDALVEGLSNLAEEAAERTRQRPPADRRALGLARQPIAVRRRQP